MARRRKGNKVDGWLIIDKPLGLTSTQVIGKVRRVYQPQKIGHAGTLDPLATGILPIAMGEATKTVPYTMEATKIYEVTARWGAETTTDDLEGDVAATSPKRPSRAEILAALPGFLGDIDQVPPAYSAIKLAGQRAYDLARAGEKVDLPARKVRIETFDLLDIPSENEANFRVTCGKGTYIRSLVRDLGRKIGCFAHVSALRRTKVGIFDLSAAISLEKLEALSHSVRAFEPLLGVATALDDIPALAVTPEEADCLRQGQKLDVTGKALERAPGPSLVSQETVISSLLIQGMKAGEMAPVAIGSIERGVLKPERVFNL
ncbi:MAG: tRNA pseudouridine(55) synthase TruB [Alphaproteobacteria bacterium]|nr:MAG: tRNA pseudouridine(55) synthase TruB [Alphaproteobacteria bacterium]